MDHYETRMLVERAKELECLYAVDEALQNKSLALPEIMEMLVDIIPRGFSEPAACRVQITLRDTVYAAEDFIQAEILNRTLVLVGEERVGEIAVGYILTLLEEECTLLNNEVKLLESISQRISLMTLSTQRELTLLLDMIQHIDPDMLLRISEKLRIHLKNTVNSNVDEVFTEIGFDLYQTMGEVNAPLARPQAADMVELGEKLIAAATSLLPQGDVFNLIRTWIQEQRIFALVKTIDNKDASIEGIWDALGKYSYAVLDAPPSNSTTETWLISELVHRFLTHDEHLINRVLDYLQISDFEPMIGKIIGSSSSMGHIGGKGAGLFIAKQLLDHAAKDDPLLQDIKTPRTWYLATDQIIDFLHYNNLEDMNSYKYNSAFHLRITYDNVVSKIKKAKLLPHTVQMLRIVLDELEETPIIVRSSSLLEDRQSSGFHGKYKSLFLANQGTKQERLEALVDAILEVYASMYNPDSVQYRRERGLLHSNEEMGVLIQEVVGQKIGHYYMPIFAGVAFSHNLLRWSSRITREGGLVRMVMGLGTRAVDRINDDYPVLFSPSQPDLRVNLTPADIRYYSPKHIDLINLEKEQFETVEVIPFLKEMGSQIPALHKYVSVYHPDYTETKNAFTLNPQKDNLMITFDPILSTGNIAQKLKRMLDVLAQKLEGPVDIEFAYDGQHIYLLQCRPQGYGIQSVPAPIPKNLNRQDIFFTANRFITNGLLADITHVVYVDGDAYNALSAREELLAVGTVVGLLNDVLPRRKYILMGPGRWGSRGDIKLGVRVTYSDISGTAALIEVAKKKHSYVPEVSFGTHFFQDLVESDIVYIPLYPDKAEVVFKESFFKYSHNLLKEILPQYGWLEEVVRVIDLPQSCQGRTLSIHLNSDLEQAVAFLHTPESKSEVIPSGRAQDKIIWKVKNEQEHWQWRQYMAQQIADSLDMEGMAVKGVYLFGSTNTGNPGLGSDIDLLFHIDGDDLQRQQLENWLDGWSRSLAKINYLHTGYNTDKLLDIHLVRDQDIEKGNSYALKIHSITDPATPLRIRE